MLTKKIVTVENVKVVTHFTNWFSPYVTVKGKERTSLKKETNKLKGLYFVRNKKTLKIEYVGYSHSSLYKTIYRHFQSWKDKQHRATFNRKNYHIKVLICRSSKIEDLEKYYIQKYKPVKNGNMYSDADVNVKNAPQIDRQTAILTQSRNAPF